MHAIVHATMLLPVLHGCTCYSSAVTAAAEGVEGCIKGLLQLPCPLQGHGGCSRRQGDGSYTQGRAYQYEGG